MRLPHSLTRSSRRFGPLAANALLGLRAHRVAALVWVFLACVLACHDDRRESFYPSLADAKRDGAIDRGWIPDFLPESSRAIHELHDISPSTTWCAFEFLPADSQALRKSLKSAGAPAPSVRLVPNPGKSWWPAVLAGNLDIEKIHGAGFELSTVVTPETPSTNEVLLFAIDWSKKRGFLYRTRQ
jgi:hypothetical protein